MICKNGFAIFEKRLNNSGMVAERKYFDVSGEPIRAYSNAASITYEYNEAGRLVSEKYYDENGGLCIDCAVLPAQEGAPSRDLPQSQSQERLQNGA